MAKCIGSVDEWKPKVIDIENPDFDVENVRQGEQILKARLARIHPLLLDIANDYIQIKQSALIDDFKVDCSQVQDALVVKLEKLQSEVLSVIKGISKSQVTRSTTHRYYILFSYATIEKIQQLLQIVGRLSEIDQKLFNEEQRKLLISDESIAIHSLTLIWTAVIKIIDEFRQQSNPVFNTEEDPQEYDFIDQLEFSTSHLQHCKILLMDLTITSWIKFNRLVKFDDLVENLPFLCRCHCRLYFKTLKQASVHNQKATNIIAELLPLILDHQSRPSMLTLSVRRAGIVPLEPCYVGSDSIELAYFIVWHLYSLSRLVNNEQRPLVGECKPILESSLDTAMKMFLPRVTQQQDFRLSPHQGERLKLVLLMLNSWCEKNPDHFSTLTRVMAFFLDHWDTLGNHYFNLPDFTINGLTIFQLLTKLYTEAIPTYTTDGQAAVVVESNNELTNDQQDLMNIWKQILAKIEPPTKNQPKPGSSKTKSQ